MTSRTCPECSTKFESDHHSKAFCSADCKRDFNNRRLKRGAVLYDLWMALRYDRAWAKPIKLWGLMCALTAEWRAEDREKGRESYIRPDRWVEQNKCWLRSVNLGNVNTGRKS